MRSSFFEFYVATSGLTTAQANLATVSHNVANASNDQYSRQYSMQKASMPMATNNGTGMIGSGSVVYGVGQCRDFYLDCKYWSQTCVLGEYNAKNTQLTLMESVLNEMLETGVLAGFDDFFSVIQDLTTSTNDNTYRTSVLQSSEQLATFINLAASSLQSQQSDINTEVSAVVATINSLGNQIANLTEAIAKYEITGESALDLRDQRAALVDELSVYVNVDVKEVECNEDVANGLDGVSDLRYYIQINGYDFVKHDQVYELECVARKAGEEVNPMDVVGLYDIQFAKSGQSFDIYSSTLTGTLGGLIDVRDGNNGNNLGYQYLPVTSTTTTVQNQIHADYDPTKDVDDREYIAGVLNPDYNPQYIENPSYVEGWNDPSSPDYNPTALQPYIDNPVYSDYTDPSGANYVEGWNDPDDSVNYIGDGWDEIGHANYRAEYNEKIENPNYAPATTYEYLTETITTTTTQNMMVPASSTDYRGIPYYLNQLNELVQTFAKAVNQGVDSNGEPITGVTGHDYGYDSNGDTGINSLFVYNGSASILSDEDYANLNCLNFCVNPDLLNNPDLMACYTDSTLGESENGVIQSFVNIGNYSGLFNQGSISDFVLSISTSLAIDKNQAENFESNYTDVVLSVQNQRLAVSGVSLNEEMMDLVKYQQLYQAAAKLVSTIDEMYDTLINQIAAR